MKVNEKVPVTIAGEVVAQANVKEVGDGTVTLVVPATLVVMATRTEIAASEPVEPTTEVVITGVDRAGGEAPDADKLDPSTSTLVNDAGEESTADAEPTTSDAPAAEVVETQNSAVE